jgi:hypothetical protein
MIGSTLAAYRILRPLGTGGMGEVFLARDTRLERDVALKLIREEFAADGQRLAGFEREARAIAALNHPSIVTIYAIEEDGGRRFFTIAICDPGRDRGANGAFHGIRGCQRQSWSSRGWFLSANGLIRLPEALYSAPSSTLPG